MNDSRRFLGELSLIIGVGVAITLLTRFLVYPWFGIGPNSPQPHRTLVWLGLLTWIIYRNGESWRDFGLKSFRPWWLVPILAVALIAIHLFVAQPIGDAVKGALDVPPSDLSFISNIEGNVLVLAGWLLLILPVVAFGEEMIMRGYVIHRLGHLWGGGWLAWGGAVVVQAVLFGALHGYAGFGTAIVVGSKAVFTGAFFLLCRRNLWPLILAHGIWDALALVLVFFTGEAST